MTKTAPPAEARIKSHERLSQNSAIFARTTKPKTFFLVLRDKKQQRYRPISSTLENKANLPTKSHNNQQECPTNNQTTNSIVHLPIEKLFEPSAHIYQLKNYLNQALT